MTTTKRPHLAFSTQERRKQAQQDASTLINLCGSLNKAAKAIEMNKGRLSCIHRGAWTTIALNEIDLTMLSVGVAIKSHDIALTEEAREEAARVQSLLAELHIHADRLIRVLRQL